MGIGDISPVVLGPLIVLTSLLLKVLLESIPLMDKVVICMLIIGISFATLFYESHRILEKEELKRFE